MLHPPLVLLLDKGLALLLNAAPIVAAKEEWDILSIYKNHWGEGCVCVHCTCLTGIENFFLRNCIRFEIN